MAINLSAFLVSSFLTFLIIVHPTLANQIGFTTSLIHRDSPLSPLSISSVNQYDRVRNSIQRSMSRINRFRTSAAGGIEAEVQGISGEYLMEISLGTPPVSQFGILDTGSDLIWVQCQPCLHCYKQVIPIFDPSKSSTYEFQSCNTKACGQLPRSQATCSSKNTCGYTYKYADQSQTIGDIASETVTFTSGSKSNAVSFPNINIGCGHDNVGIYGENGSGIIGLGAGPLSLVSQLGSSIGGKFSYCLIPFDKQGNYTSKINFGTNGEVSGPDVISTPIIKGEVETFYYLTLEGLSVGASSKISVSKKSSKEEYGSSNSGNIIIDSGTLLTLVPEEMYSDFQTALVKAVKSETVDDPTGQLPLCFKDPRSDPVIPDITFHFDGGDLVLKSKNTFLKAAEGILCLAIVPGSDVGIFGFIAQMDLLVGYDTQKGTVSFKHTDCTTA